MKVARLGGCLGFLGRMNVMTCLGLIVWRVFRSATALQYVSHVWFLQKQLESSGRIDLFEVQPVNSIRIGSYR